MTERKRLAAVFILLASGVAAPQSTAPKLFPGGVGSYWIYRGLTRFQGADNTVVEKKVSCRMTVERVLHRDGATAVIVNGSPDDMDWSEGQPQIKESVFVRTDDGRLYRFVWESGNPEQRFTDTHVPMPELLDQAELLLQWPPVAGAQPGGGNCPDRSDEMYCWVLDSAKKVPLRGISGVKPGAYTAYSVAYRTNPDTEIMDIVPGVGVVTYLYSHHGTVDDVELSLVELHLTPEK